VNPDRNPITSARRAVHALLDVPEAGCGVYLWLPGSADDLPAICVGRPLLEESADVRSVVEVTVPVYVLGRTLRDDEAQAQLDTLADWVTGRLWAPPSDSSIALRLVETRATVTAVADRETPSYTAQVVASMAYC
jgi:hypothetical protein